jgi:hypothetical protein
MHIPKKTKKRRKITKKKTTSDEQLVAARNNHHYQQHMRKWVSNADTFRRNSVQAPTSLNLTTKVTSSDFALAISMYNQRRLDLGVLPFFFFFQ